MKTDLMCRVFEFCQFFLGHAGFDHMAAVGRVVFFLQALTSFLARQGA